MSDVTRFDFRFALPYLATQVGLGITPLTTGVSVSEEEVRVRFGPWRLRTPLGNVVSVERTGGFNYLLTAGPPHLSFADRGVSFATNSRAAVCLQFRYPVAGIDPLRLIRHPGATLTLTDVDGFVELLGELGVPLLVG